METQLWRAFAVNALTILMTGSMLVLASCGQPNQMTSTPSMKSGNGGQQNNSPLTICSALDFSQVSWPVGLNAADQSAFALALNISGSFEGSSGWANLTNNFDGQGLSMGLLNQNLGQGSLQPLLVGMRNTYMSTMQTIFSAADLTSLLGMLSQWETAIAAEPNVAPRLNILDMTAFSISPLVTTSTPETASVAWAAANLYSGSSFVTRWSTELNALANSPQYISIQVQAAAAMHTASVSGISASGVHELRTYLMLFDIEVQDGSVLAADWSDYATWVSQNPQSTDTQKLTELLTLRLRHVASAYVADVQSRKMAIINGSGVVHQTNRNLQTQYCYNGLSAFH